MSEYIVPSDHVRVRWAEALRTLDRGEGPIVVTRYKNIVAVLITNDDYEDLKRLRAEEAERVEAQRTEADPLAERMRQTRKKAPRLAKKRRRPRT